MSIADNLEIVTENIKEAAENAGGKPEEIKLCAVTKTASVQEIIEAIEAGVKCIGESRVHLAQDKFQNLPPVEKHMIGHLQTNKVKKAVEIFDCIQSVDSLRLAKEINKRAMDFGKVMQIMLQINVSGEDQKFGVSPEEVGRFYNEILKLTNLKVKGVMTIAPFIEDEDTKYIFRKTKAIADELNLKEISMGMTNDYKIAIEEGSTMVRVGRAIFKKE